MTVKTEGKHTEEFLLREGNGDISRESILLLSGQTAVDGQAIKDNGSGKAIVAAGTHNTAGVSTETILGIICGNYTAVSADTRVAYIARLATVKDAVVTYHSGGADAAKKAAVKAALKALLIIQR